MGEVVEGGASLAWRLLATLEGGSFLLATSALLAYSARKRVAKLKRTRRPVRSVLLTNITNVLGKEIKAQLESRGCTVHTYHTINEEVINSTTSSTSEETTNFAISGASGSSNLLSDTGQVDALVVVGSFSPPKLAGLQGMAKLVSEDVYSNLKLLQSLSTQVRRGGCVAWACAGAGGARTGAGDAFDAVLRANLHHVAKMWKSHCEPVWVNRSDDPKDAAERIVEALLSGNGARASSFSFRNAAHKVGEYICRWLKIVT